MGYYKNLAIAEEDIEQFINHYKEGLTYKNPDFPESSVEDYKKMIRRCVKGIVDYLDQMSHEDIIPIIVGEYRGENEDLGELFQFISQECMRRQIKKSNRKHKSKAEA